MFRKMCTPAFIYLIISICAIVVLFIQNIGLSKTYCLGSYTCNVESTTLIFVAKILYVIFWTWILNIICKSGHTGVAWFLVLLPFLLFFIILALILIK